METETPRQPRRLGGFLAVLALIGVVAVVWAAVALASGSGSTTTPSSSTSTPTASYGYAANGPAQFTAAGTPGDCPDHDGSGGSGGSGTITPATPTTPSTTTTDGSTNPSL